MLTVLLQHFTNSLNILFLLRAHSPSRQKQVYIDSLASTNKSVHTNLKMSMVMNPMTVPTLTMSGK